MKSSKIENIPNYKRPDINTLSPLTYYHPFQSTFDPEFFYTPPKSLIRPNTPQMIRWSQVTERSAAGPSTFEGISNTWELDSGSSMSQASAPARAEDVKNSFAGPSTSGREKPEGRILCNSTWRTPAIPKPPFSGHEENPNSKCRYPSNFGALRIYSRNPTAADGLNGGLGGASSDGASPVVKGAFSPPSRQFNFDGNFSQSPCYPFMLGSSGKNTSQNFFKTVATRPMMCNFCKNNKEVPDIYLNHYLYDPETKVLSCPVLRKHVCELCGGTGDQAHTLQYCPLNKERGLQSKVPVLLKTRTITNSTGKIRRN